MKYPSKDLYRLHNLTAMQETVLLLTIIRLLTTFSYLATRHGRVPSDTIFLMVIFERDQEDIMTSSSRSCLLNTGKRASRTLDD